MAYSVRDIQKKRESIIKAYNGAEGMRQKVNKMTADQVVAFYLRLRDQKKL